MSSQHFWRIIHFLIYVIAVCSSFAAILPAFEVQHKFRGKCPLFADISVKKLHFPSYDDEARNMKFRDTDDAKDDMEDDAYLVKSYLERHHQQRYATYYFEKSRSEIENQQDIWTSIHVCNFSVYSPVVSFMFATIWAWFFCICSGDNQGGIGITKPWRLVPPATFFTIVMTIVILVAAVVMTQGMQHFCNRLEQSPVGGCWNAEQVVWTHYPHLQGFYGQHLRAVAALWVCTSAWCVATIVLLIRCCCTNVDFATNHGGMTPMDQIRRRASYEHLQQEEQA